MRQTLTTLMFALSSLTLQVGCKSKPETKPDQDAMIVERPVEQEVQSGAERAAAHVERGKQALQARDWRGAASAYASAVKEDPQNWQLWVDLAIARAKVPDFQGAIEAIRVAMERGGEREWKVWYNLGNIYQNRGMYQEGIKAYRVALGLESEQNLDVLVNLSSAYVYLGRFDEAKETISYILSIEPRETRALHNSAMIPHMKYDYEEALIAYDAVLEIDPSFAQSIFNRAHVLSSMGRFAEAAQGYERYVQVEPQGAFVERAQMRAEEYRKR